MEKKKILIVDDEENLAEMVKLNLEDTGEFEVRVETEGLQAIAAAEEFRPDLILLDIIMPDMDGSEVANKIKNVQDLKDIPIVFLTAMVSEDEVSSKKGVIGGYPFIPKPISVERLVNTIKRNIA